jgi:hypothetical protein
MGDAPGEFARFMRLGIDSTVEGADSTAPSTAFRLNRCARPFTVA